MKFLFGLNLSVLFLFLFSLASFAEQPFSKYGTRQYWQWWNAVSNVIENDTSYRYYYNTFDDGQVEPPNNFTGYGGNTSSSFSIVAGEGIITKGTTASKRFAYDDGYWWGDRYFEVQVKNFSDGVRINTWPVYIDDENYITVFTSGARFAVAYRINNVFTAFSTGDYFAWSDDDYFGVNVESRGNSVIAVECYQNGFLWRTDFIPYDSAIATGSVAIGCENDDMRIDNLLVKRPIDTIPTTTATATPTLTITQTATPTPTITQTATVTPTSTATPSYTSPMLNSPTAYAATWRDEDCGTYGIMTIRGSLNGTKSVYDVEKGTANIQVGQSPEVWIDAEANTAEVWYLVTMYNQASTGWDIFMTQSTTSNQPIIEFDKKNGWPVFYGDVDTDYFYTENSMGTYTNEGEGSMFVNYKPTGTPETQSATYNLPPILSDNSYFGLHRGIRGSGDDRIYAYTWGPGDEYAAFKHTLGTWYTIALVYQDSEVRLFVDGTEEDDEPTNAIHGGLNNAWNTISKRGANDLGGSINSYIAFDTELTDAQIENISSFMEDH